MKHRNRSRSFIITDTAGFWSRPGATALLIFLSIFLMSLSVMRPGMMETARAGASDAITPLLSTLAKPFQYSVFLVRDISGLAQMQAEIASLRLENGRLQGWYQQAVALQAENQSLRDLMHVKVEVPHEFISARVIADSSNSYVKSLLVLAGKQDGVEKGQAVLSAKGLIGRVIEVGNNSARILLITDINSRVPVVIEGFGYHAVMAGTNAEAPVLDHLADTKALSSRAPVITSGRGGMFPAGLPVGYAMPLESGAGHAAKPSVYPYADFQALPFVKIVNSQIDPNLKEASSKR